MRVVAKTSGLLLIGALLLLLGGCATNEPIGDTGLFDFLIEGETTKQDILLTLGQPSGVYEEESVYAYRVLGDEQIGYRIKSVEPRGWHGITYSLVLIFDEQDVLKKYSLVSVN